MPSGNTSRYATRQPKAPRLFAAGRRFVGRGDARWDPGAIKWRGQAGV